MEDDIDYKFYVIEFINRGPKRKTRCVDIVPAEWIEFEKNKGLKVRYMDAPYDAEDIKLIHDLCKNCMPAPADWPVFSIDLLARANTYKEAEDKLETVKIKKDAFTATESENDDELSTREKTEQNLKKRKLIEQQKQMENLILKQNHVNPKICPGINNPTCDSDYMQKNPLGDITQAVNFNNNQIENSIFSKDPKILSITPSTSITEASDIIFQPADDFQTLMVNGMANLQIELSQIKNFLIDKKITNKHVPDLAKKYSLHIPFELVENFLAFDSTLGDDDFLKADIVAVLRSEVNIFNISQSINGMFKKFFKKDVATQFTAARKSRTKETVTKFKDTQLWRLIKMVIIAERKMKNMDTCEKDLIKNLSDVLTNVDGKW